MSNMKRRRHLNPKIKQVINDIGKILCYLVLAAECAVIVAAMP